MTNTIKKNIIFIVGIIIVIAIIFIINFVVGKKNLEREKAALLSGKHYVEIVVADYGNIQLELDADTAPITVTNFIKLVNQKFYDGLTFHRVVDGFMIQGGDPKGAGTGGSSETIKGEFTANGVTNNISHKRGVISMARSNSMNSASSQFFIMHQDNAGLDGNYAAFGHVIEGMDVVDKIVEKTPVEEDGESVLPENQPVITSIREINPPAIHEIGTTNEEE